MKKILIIFVCALTILCMSACTEQAYEELDLAEYSQNNNGEVNIVLTEQNYLDKKITGQGYVGEINSDSFQLFYDTYMSYVEFSHLNCFFDKSDSDLVSQIAQLKQGDKIKVYGKITKVNDDYPTKDLDIHLDKIEFLNQ